MIFGGALVAPSSAPHAERTIAPSRSGHFLGKRRRTRQDAIRETLIWAARIATPIGEAESAWRINSHPENPAKGRAGKGRRTQRISARAVDEERASAPEAMTRNQASNFSPTPERCGEENGFGPASTGCVHKRALFRAQTKRLCPTGLGVVGGVAASNGMPISPGRGWIAARLPL